MRPFLFRSLAVSEEADLEDSLDSGWRLCLRLHGPLHPEGLSPHGHELPFLFEQVWISHSLLVSRHTQMHTHTPKLNPLPYCASSKHRISAAVPGTVSLGSRPRIPLSEVRARKRWQLSR